MARCKVFSISLVPRNVFQKLVHREYKVGSLGNLCIREYNGISINIEFFSMFFMHFWVLPLYLLPRRIQRNHIQHWTRSGDWQRKLTWQLHKSATGSRIKDNGLGWQDKENGSYILWNQPGILTSLHARSILMIMFMLLKKSPEMWKNHGQWYSRQHTTHIFCAKEVVVGIMDAPLHAVKSRLSTPQNVQTSAVYVNLSILILNFWIKEWLQGQCNNQAYRLWWKYTMWWCFSTLTQDTTTASVESWLVAPLFFISASRK